MRIFGDDFEGMDDNDESLAGTLHDIAGVKRHHGKAGIPNVTDPTQAKRLPVDYRYDTLNWEFIKRMAQLASYAGKKYDDARQYTLTELADDRAPINHIPEHYRSFMAGESHDYFEGRSWHLVAIAYNAMMQFFYETGAMPGDVTKPYVAEIQPADGRITEAAK